MRSRYAVIGVIVLVAALALTAAGFALFATDDDGAPAAADTSPIAAAEATTTTAAEPTTAPTTTEAPPEDTTTTTGPTVPTTRAGSSTTKPPTTTTGPRTTTTTTTRPRATTTSVLAASDPPVIRITAPASQSRHAASFNSSRNAFTAAVPLSATVSDPNGDPVTVEWFSSIDGFLGTGTSITAILMPQGDASQPVITAVATDATGARSEASRQIVVWIPSDQ